VPVEGEPLFSRKGTRGTALLAGVGKSLRTMDLRRSAQRRADLAGLAMIAEL
jgi:hypothetical protein